MSFTFARLAMSKVRSCMKVFHTSRGHIMTLPAAFIGWSTARAN
jgi:hypothetical protein